MQQLLFIHEQQRGKLQGPYQVLYRNVNAERRSVKNFVFGFMQMAFSVKIVAYLCQDLSSVSQKFNTLVKVLLTKELLELHVKKKKHK